MRSSKEERMSKKGFTLIELLVVVIIIGVLTSIALPQYRKAMDRSKAAEAMQVLPSLFEARERWVIEHQCLWNSGAISCSDGSSFNPQKLDIETPGAIDKAANKITTKNFEYQLINSKPASSQQACISAKPLWGGSRGLTGAMIYYRGDKFSCTDGDGKACDILNVAESDHRTGCI